MQNKNWLPHLTEEMMVGARNNNLCSYAVALEGWRRGLELKFYSKKVKQNRLHVPGCLFSLSDGKKTHMFYKSKGERVKREAFTIGDNKYKSKKVLEQNGVPVPKGNLFSNNATHDEIIQYANEIGYPVVLKPSAAAQGKGVIANIDNEDFLRKSLIHIREELNYPEVILEEHVNGEEYRVYVMEDQVIAVLNRIPANIVGNGKNTIKELINRKNNARKKNPRLYSCLIKVDYEIKNRLEKEGRTLETVPANGETVYLRQKSNISSGGDSVDVTDEFPEEVKQVAIEALKAIPNFPNGGVDVMVDFSKPLKEASKVIELTPVPQIGSILFPMKGKSRDVPAAIIDYYFPETKTLRNNNPNIYFYLPEILAPLMSKAAEEVTVIPCPNNMEIQRKYKIEGTVQKVGFRRWIRKKALEADLYGYAENQLDGTLLVAVAGTEKDVLGFEEICKQGPKKAKVINVSSLTWEGAIRVGFEIKRNLKKPKQKKISTKATTEQASNTTVKKKYSSKSRSFLSVSKKRIKKIIEPVIVKSAINGHKKSSSKDDLIKALRRYPNNIYLLQAMAEDTFKHKDFKKGLKYWDKLNELKGLSSINDYVRYAIILEENKQNSKSLKILKNAEKQYPNEQDVLVCLLKKYIKIKDNAKIVSYYPRVSVDNLDTFGFYLMKDVYDAHMAEGYKQDANQIMEKMIQRFPEQKELIEYEIKQRIIERNWNLAMDATAKIDNQFEKNVLMSMIYQVMGKQKQARKMFNNTIEKHQLTVNSDLKGYRKIILFDNGESRIEYYKKLSPTKKVIITFDAINMVWDEPSFAFRLLSKENLDIIAIRKKERQTYQQDLTQEEFVHVVSPVLEGYEDKMAYGFSLGAYQTLYLASLLNCRILALAPRLSIHPIYGRTKVIPKYEMLHNETLPANTMISPLIVYDSKNELDQKYVTEGILPNFPNAQLIKLPYAGHSIGPYLRDTGQLKSFVYQFLKGETPVFNRKMKHKSIQYYKNLSKMCYKRKKFRWALNIAELCLNENPKDTDAIKVKIKSLKALNRLDDAQSFGIEASNLLKENLDIQLYLIDIYIEQKKIDMALEQLKSLEKYFGSKSSIKKRYNILEHY